MRKDKGLGWEWGNDLEPCKKARTDARARVCVEGGGGGGDYNAIPHNSGKEYIRGRKVFVVKKNSHIDHRE